HRAGVEHGDPRAEGCAKHGPVGGCSVLSREFREDPGDEANDLAFLEIADQDSELLSSVASDGVGLAKAAAQQSREGGQDAVTDGMSVSIIDRLEQIEID